MKALPKKPYARIHLPALTAEEALLISSIFDKASDAIWRAHGYEMQKFLYDGYKCPVEEDVEPVESSEPEQGDEFDEDEIQKPSDCEYPF
jgi:hypothetical protein